ncbi:hypothetical protein HAZT_HAZT000168 [Hyalella azteca]|uniref:NAD-dependent epimerase/dehydratase domain-containing protein n=1 Tax=Hyalella azteca TaxID=294128 RepID=A0A6A0H1A5_HYAAZ|nr:hypothetical protein HAZT_HAZT000168 [Hyalella azteca]
MSDQMVLVTGASGYIACHVVKLLQETGYRVRGTVRSLKNSSRVDPLKMLVSNPKHPLELTEADLESDDGWDKAMEGVYAVMHTASPFPSLEESPSEQSLVIPAVEGTKRVLSAAAKAGVKKVVVTSSCSAVVEGQRFELSTVNPVLVMGPPLVESNKSATSVIILRDAIMAKVPGSPKLCFRICDVRDVALAHLKCLTNPEAVGKRHIISSGGIWMKDMNQILADEFKPQNYKVSTRELPNFVIWFASIFNERIRKQVYPRLGVMFDIDNSRMKNVLGIEPTPQKDSILDMAYAMIELGIVAKTSAYKGPKFSEWHSSGSTKSGEN